MKISISKEVKHACPGLRLGILTAVVKVYNSEEGFWKEFEAFLEHKAKMDFESIREIANIASSRSGYKLLGADPSRYRLSAEALHRRLVKGNPLYKVNNVVDIINIISLKSGISIGGYDLEKIQVPVTLMKGKKNIPYQAIGRGELNIENLPVLTDSSGPFGSPTSDSVRTMIREETKKIGLVFFDFGQNPGLQNYLDDAFGLLKKYAASIDQKLTFFE